MPIFTVDIPFEGIPRLRPANDIRCPEIRGGFRIQHGHFTWVMAEDIGRNFLASQNVTIGVAKGGKPVIGVTSRSVLVLWLCRPTENLLMPQMRRWR